MSEIAFDKYAVKGAYHWIECFGPIHRLNAYTLARYHLILSALREAGIGAQSRILDVGCGDGALAGLIAMQTKASIHGVDTSLLSIQMAQREFAGRNLNGVFATIDGYDYPYEDGVFAAVVCSDVIEHVQKPEIMLREMWRVLAPGGILVVTTPVKFTETPLDRMHVQEWFPTAFKTLCSESLGKPVELRLSHPVALAELYASSAPMVGRLSRMIFNVLAKLGNNPFQWTEGFRSFSTQAVVAVKPVT